MTPGLETPQACVRCGYGVGSMIATRCVIMNKWTLQDSDPFQGISGCLLLLGVTAVGSYVMLPGDTVARSSSWESWLPKKESLKSGPMQDTYVKRFIYDTAMANVSGCYLRDPHILR